MIRTSKYTYNTGEMLQSNVLLFVITKEKKYLEEAQRIAGSTEKYSYRNNKLPDNYWFNVVLL
ncbi:glycoside hydrolase family 76 protein [Dyadobacter diqingensis]|uniref:glycoside hydrolase family 76 protein n=1 Tax=Dyadobacter diqingensis TaxID=2938121 RepID=UPI002111921F|nr:glycoside hydrolase family 76 protein [Dyadobacter diqingensis]